MFLFIVGFIVGVLVLILLIPLIIAYSPSLLLKTIFTRDRGTPTESSFYENKAKRNKFRNFYVSFQDKENNNITLGVYHVLPSKYTHNIKELTDEQYDQFLWHSPYPVLLVFHGRGQTRSYFEKKYVLLSNFFHVLIFDYRCFADSTIAVLTKQALVDDCTYIYKWLSSKTTSDIYVWGHSLGSALCIETVHLLNKESIIPKGIILEASFTCFEKAVLDSPFGMFSCIPTFSILLKSYKRHGFIFNSCELLSEIKSPVMIIHAKDDKEIPFQQGLELFSVASNRNINNNITKFVGVEGDFKCGHSFIYNFPDFIQHISDFIEMCKMESDRCE